jgi:hypothetical protein
MAASSGFKSGMHRHCLWNSRRDRVEIVPATALTCM